MMAAPLGLLAQDLVARATGLQLGRWQEQVAATGHCAHPIRLTGRTMHVDRPPARSARSTTCR